jgi:hypothetical protein
MFRSLIKSYRGKSDYVHNSVTSMFISLLIPLFILSCSEVMEKPVTEQTVTVLEAKDSLRGYPETLSIIGVGDIMMGSNYPSARSLPPDDGAYLFESVKNILPDANITFGNLEGTFLNAGGIPKRCSSPSNCVSFRMPEHYAEYLKDAGFDVVSIANNHFGDMGDIGRTSTINTLDRYGIKYAGSLSNPFSILEVNGIRIGIVAFAPNTGTLSINDLEGAVDIVTALQNICEVLIVSIHGGAEGTSSQRVSRKREFYLGEDRGNVYEFSHAVIDAGADVVFGHGPHVARAIELYKGRIIAYSLGNFCTYGKFGLSGALGYAPILKIFVDRKGEFIEGKITSAKQINGGFPVIDPEDNALKLIKELSLKDFPESALSIDINGNVIRSDITRQLSAIE